VKRFILIVFTYLLWSAANQTFAQNYLPRFIQLPSIQMRCLPNTPTVTFDFFWSNLPMNTQKRAETIASARKQNIFIGYQKFGPFDEDEGLLSLTCNTMGKTLIAEFTYQNFPHLRLGDGQPNILAYGQCDDLSRLDIKHLSLNNVSLTSFISGALDTCYQNPKLSSVEIDVTARQINLCTIPGPFEPAAPPAHKIECVTKKF